MMRPDDRRVDHLQGRIGYFARPERLQDRVPDAASRPAAELPPDGVPVAQLPRQIAPWRASAHDPEHRVENLTMIARRTPPFLDQEGFEIRPLFVPHQAPNHRRSP